MPASKPVPPGALSALYNYILKFSHASSDRSGELTCEEKKGNAPAAIHLIKVLPAKADAAFFA
jgi:hypothetical protein